MMEKTMEKMMEKNDGENNISDSLATLKVFLVRKND